MDERELSHELDGFFGLLDAAFPSGEIIWENWNHESWDKTALKLCSALGYSSGAPFLTAYGYGIFVDGKHIPATGSRPIKSSAPSKESAPVEASPSIIVSTPAEAVPTVEEVKPPKPVSEAPQPEPVISAPEFFTGTVRRVLPYNNSGFIRSDNGGEYYFNVRDFTHHVNLRSGIRVRFKLKQRFDHKHNKNRLNAVEISVL